ncbi:MAG: hypothetical protein C0591_00430 [Marinilabiliales bacterium]|nr:MAG: hypothetical protein C0591_00430 [Marinilabiliales bacterium]
MKFWTKYVIVPLFVMGLIALTATSCDKDEEVEGQGQVPTLTTSAVINITTGTATSGGNISDNYNSPITARGVCWGTDPTPNLSGNKTVDGVGIGPFQSNLTGLSADQIYYVRAYATNASGTGYGSSLQFKTLPNQGQAPTLTTASVINITSSSATSGGNITSDNGSSVTARGVCWSINPTPTINDSKTIDGTGIGSFQSSITGLSPDQTYYIRAYATNASGTGYGSALQFLTLGGGGATVTDADGNTYNTVTIGTQVWLKENLKTTKYNDGSPIPHEPNGWDWMGLTTPAYTWYEDDYEQFGTVYGALYNWYVCDPASNGNKNVCPAGWHVPSKDEFNILLEYLGGSAIAGGKMKEAGTEHWQDVNVGATNESGFTGLGAGGIAANYSRNIKRYGTFWTTTPAEIPENYAYKISLFHGSEFISANSSTPRWHGVSVRCIKD